MNYSVNLGKWNSVFAVPTDVVDKHIKLAGSMQLKVLLWMLRHAGKSFDINEIASVFNVHVSDIKDAMQYWIESGVLISPEFQNVPEENKVSYQNPNLSIVMSDKTCVTKPKTTFVRYQRPDSLHIATRIKESDEISFMMQEAQVVLGRPISNGDSAVLLMLHDNDGLPVDVIIMLLQYAVNAGKKNMKYIEKVGVSWANDGIDTHEKAEEKIVTLSKSNIAWRKFEKIIGIDHRSPTAKEEETIPRWINDWHYCDELIKEAYDRCVTACGKYRLKYIDSILTRWNEQSIHTLEQAIMDSNKKSKKYGKNQKESNAASYNIEEYEKYNIFDEMG